MTTPRKHILIVEDAQDIADSMQDLLTAEGYAVTCASTGRKALERLRAQPELPDLILLDLMMPDMDGQTFRAEQRKDPRLARVPVVLMTASGDASALAVELEARAVLRKPFKDLDSILDSIKRSS